MKWKILFLGLLILILISGCTTNNSPEIDQELEKAIKDLKEGKTVKMSVIVKDDSGPADWVDTDVTVSFNAVDEGSAGLKATFFRVNGLWSQGIRFIFYGRDELVEILD